MDFKEALQNRRIFFDGGMGTMLQQYGLKPGESPMRYNLQARASVTEIHHKYLDAGADVITANTFGAYTTAYTDAAQLIEAAVENARSALTGREGWIAMDMGPTGRLMEPMGDLCFEEGYRLFQAAAQTGAACGVDLIIVETMTDLRETKAAVLAAKETGLPVVVSMTFDERGRTLTGADISCMAALLDGLSVDAMGMNCGYGPELYLKLLPELIRHSTVPVLLQPNAGLPNMVDGIAHYDISPEAFAEYMTEMARLGTWLLGGCCGTTPAHIRAVVERVGKDAANKRVSAANPAAAYAICSGMKSIPVDISAGREALSLARCSATDIENLIDEAMDLSETAAVVEIWVNKPEDIEAVQEMVRVPLSLDADSLEVLLEAVRRYNGRPLVNAAARGLSGDREYREALTAYGAIIL